jgi:hypothetical protein
MAMEKSDRTLNGADRIRKEYVDNDYSDAHVPSTKNSVQLNNYSNCRASSVQARQYVEYFVTWQKVLCMPMKSKDKSRANSGEETAPDILSAPRTDLRTDVKRGHIMGHRRIGLLSSMFFSIVSTEAVTRVGKRSEEGSRGA